MVRGIRHKHVVGHNGLHGALYYDRKFDATVFAVELVCAALTTGLLFLASTGPQSGIIFKSGYKGIAAANALLLYKDVKLRLLQPPNEASLIVLKMTINASGTRPSVHPSGGPSPLCALVCVPAFSARVWFIILEDIALEEHDSTRLDQFQVILANETAVPIANQKRTKSFSEKIAQWASATQQENEMLSTRL